MWVNNTCCCTNRPCHPRDAKRVVAHGAHDARNVRAVAVVVGVGVPGAAQQHVPSKRYLAVAGQVGVQAVDPCSRMLAGTRAGVTVHTGVEDTHPHAAVASDVCPGARSAHVDEAVLQRKLRVVGHDGLAEGDGAVELDVQDARVVAQLGELLCGGRVGGCETECVEAEVVHEGAPVVEVGVAGGKVGRGVAQLDDEMGILCGV